jgi:hypothetical protein
MGFNIARSVGPAVGGLIVAAAVPWPFTVNAASYPPLIVVLMRWRPVTARRVLPRETLHGGRCGHSLRVTSPVIRTVLVARAFRAEPARSWR